MTTWMIGLVAAPLATIPIAAILFVPTYRRLKRAAFCPDL
jgi:hypothetical protein